MLLYCLLVVIVFYPNGRCAESRVCPNIQMTNHDMNHVTFMFIPLKPCADYDPNQLSMRSFEVSNDRLGLLYGLSSSDAEPNLASLPQQHPTSSARLKRDSSRYPEALETSHHVSEARSDRRSGGDNVDPEIKVGKFRFKKTGSSRPRRSDVFDSRPHHRSRIDVEEDRNSSFRDHEGHRHGRSEKRRRHHRSDDKHRQHRRSSSSRKEKEKVDFESKGFTNPPRQPLDDPAAYDDTYLPNAQTYKYDPDIAFRESLFDAMADDEGAAFWEGVYGQRVDVYPRLKVEGSSGALEDMDDDEYAAYVREKMYQNSNEYVFQERTKREKARIEAKERKKREQEEWEEAEQRRLRREQARRQKKSKENLKKAWEEYLTAWSHVTSERKKEDILTSFSIPWPVASAQLKDVSHTTVEGFYKSAPMGHDGDEFFNLIKAERVKWHPDKIQQRWGQLEGEIMAGVNTTFQTIDAMWTEQRNKRTKAATPVT